MIFLYVFDKLKSLFIRFFGVNKPFIRFPFIEIKYFSKNIISCKNNISILDFCEKRQMFDTSFCFIQIFGWIKIYAMLFNTHEWTIFFIDLKQYISEFIN